MAASEPIPAPIPQPAMHLVRPHAGWALLGWLTLCELTGGLAGLAAAGSVRTWYATLSKPPLNPPDWIFAPVWTILYAVMALAAWQVWKTRNSTCRRRGLRLFLVQLFLNLSWTYLFFAAHSAGAALAEIIMLAVAIALTARTFFKMTHLAGWLMLLYLAWVLFAGYLNLGIWKLNS